MFFFLVLLMFKGQCSRLKVQRPALNAEQVSGIVNNDSQGKHAAQLRKLSLAQWRDYRFLAYVFLIHSFWEVPPRSATGGYNSP